MKKLLLLACVFLLSMSFALAVVVSPSSPGSWIIDGVTESSLGGSGSGSYVTGPLTPPDGVGSVYLSTTVNGGVALFNYGTLTGLPLSQLTELKYSTYADTGLTTRPNFQMNVDYYCDQESWDGRLVYIPPANEVVNGAWQEWNALTGLWQSSSSSISNEDESGTETLSFALNGGTPTSLADILAVYPNACIHSTFGGYGVKIGTYSFADEGNVDSIKINGELYNFEPDTVEEIPEFGVLAGVMIAIVAGLFIWKRRSN